MWGVERDEGVEAEALEANKSPNSVINKQLNMNNYNNIIAYYNRER